MFPKSVNWALIFLTPTCAKMMIPTHRRTRAYSLDHDRPSDGCMDLEGDPSTADEEEGVGDVTLGQQQLARGIGHVPGASRHLGYGVTGQAGEQRVRGDDLGDRSAHRVPPGDVADDRMDPSLARMAAASSVRSLPTGHQAMQRPQPTHPEVSNWSHQVDSLWVSH